ncbi:MAG TPA: helix-turn-helix transcriptional regulator [Candidatus Polarisedimenticolia bacterium]|nr:helix-turn-helix transcriptional regulator [Candidatus Polarisedimenticolia bacterium]
MRAFERSRGSGGRPHDDRHVTGVDIAWRRVTPLVRVSRWRCHERAHGLTAERQQFWRVIAFVHEGAYETRGPRGRGLVDPLHVGLFHPGEPYRTSHPCGLGDHGSALVLREDLFDDILRARLPGAAERPERLDAVAPCPTSALRRHRALLRAIDSDERIEESGVEEMVIAIADEILAALADRGRRAPQGGGRAAPEGAAAHRELAEAAQAVLGAGFRRQVRLASMAAHLGVSPAHLCRVFRKATGRSIHDYLTRLRLRAALEPLASGERDLSALAFDLGFSSHSHFTSAFRREFGLHPSAWRGRPAGRRDRAHGGPGSPDRARF